MSSITKNQHYVPQFYLKSFTNSNNELNIFNVKNKRRETSRGTKRICAEDFFYAMKTGEEDEISQQVESLLNSEFETPFSASIPQVVKKIEENKKINNQDKYNLALFMNIMWMRNPAMRDFLNKAEEEMYRFSAKSRFNHPSIEAVFEEMEKGEGRKMSKQMKRMVIDMITNDQYNLIFSNQSHLHFMLDSENISGFTNLFYAQYWTIHVSQAKLQFVTSDNPVSVVIPERKGFYGASFLERRHIFPLSPKILIEAKYPKSPHQGKTIKRKTYFGSDVAEIEKLNFEIANHALNYVYSAREEEINFFTEYVRDRKKEENLTMRKIVSLIGHNSELKKYSH